MRARGKRGGGKHGRGACGERKTGCARTSRGVGEAAMMEGISPGRAAAETSPDRTAETFRRGRGPPLETFSDLGPPPKFFHREGMTSKYFSNQYVMEFSPSAEK